MARVHGVECKIDYVRVRFATHDIEKVIEQVLRIQKNYFLEEKNGLYGYVGKYSLSDIWVFNSIEGDDRGILLQLAGKGCRLFEQFLLEQGRTWQEFFDLCLKSNGNFTRLDIAIDDYTEYISIPQALRKVERKEFASIFRKITPKYSINPNDKKTRKGLTIDFGSKQSEMHISFYQKNYEIAQRENIPVEAVDVKNRYEIRFADGYANLIAQYLIDGIGVDEVGFGILREKMVFTKTGCKKKGKRQIEKWLDNGKIEMWENWERLIDGHRPFKISTNPIDSEYIQLKKKENWLKYTVYPSVLLFKEIDEFLETNYIVEMESQAMNNRTAKNEHLFEVATTRLKDMIINEQSY